MSTPTHQDASLMVQMEQVWAAGGLSEAAAWMLSDEFVSDYGEFLEKYPAGSEGQHYVYKLMRWFEIVGALHKHGLINEALLADWVAADLAWNRMKGIALGMRERVGDERVLEKFEALAKAQKVR